MSKVGIISAGAWGTAIGHAIAKSNHEVFMWDFMPEVCNDINQNNQNSKFLYGVQLSPNMKAMTDLQEAIKGKDFIILATPSKYLLPIVKKMILSPDVQEGKPIIGIITKGFIEHNEMPQLLTVAIENILPGFYKEKLVYISGPSHAEEVARGKITGLVSASKEIQNALAFKTLLSSPTLKIVESEDVEGVQICAAIKNVIAIAYGILDALTKLNDQYGDNTESMLLAAGLNEMMKLGIAMGSTHPETFTSLAGVGDLDVTCKSKYGRNRNFGREIMIDKKLCRFKDIEDLMENVTEIGYLPEGIFAAAAAIKFIQSKKIQLPIIESVYKVLNKEIEPQNIFKELLSH